MNKSIFILILILAGCTVSQDITDNSQDIIVKGKTGIYGIAKEVGGPCVPDPEAPENCITAKPYATIISLEIKKYSTLPKRTDPIVKSLETDRDGSFEVDMPPGNYCIWAELECQEKVEIKQGEWKYVELVVAMP